MFRKLDDHVSVYGQLAPEEVAEAAGEGFALIVNNRPDGEQPGQPTTADMEAAARAAGIGYVAIPVDHSGFSEAQVARMAETLAGAAGPVLAYCRSGTRSTYLWALARARLGDDPATLIEKAAAADYDLTPLAPMLEVE